MKPTKPEQFIHELELVDEKKAHLLKMLRKKILSINSKIQEKIMYGGILFGREKFFCGLFAHKTHLSVELENGHKINDPKGLLEGTGKSRRHLKIHDLNDVTSKNVMAFVKQAYKIMHVQGNHRFP